MEACKNMDRGDTREERLQIALDSLRWKLDSRGLVLADGLGLLMASVGEVPDPDAVAALSVRPLRTVEERDAWREACGGDWVFVRRWAGNERGLRLIALGGRPPAFCADAQIQSALADTP